MAEFVPSWGQPTHPDRLQVIKGDQPFQSSARSLISLPAGALFAKITTATHVNQTTYTSVADGANSRIELNSDLVYCNHSCQPSLIFDMTRFEVRVVDNRSLSVGDELTFFYPSSEWAMVQPFQCECIAGADQCLGLISGSRDLEPDVLQRCWLNDHVWGLLAEKMQRAKETPCSDQVQHGLTQKSAA
ncbi:SET domain-containing protein [Aspergillus stella-maris]|uniref:SET domain-containing protein n=1 Tax=Aspergillus stella-maris TaxID=1810926 RepID=UPI003CCDD694